MGLIKPDAFRVMISWVPGRGEVAKLPAVVSGQFG